MLKPEDCKPGVEVIAITNKSKFSGTISYNPDKPLLSLGMIYTINRFCEDCLDGDLLKDLPNISLNELPLANQGETTWAYMLDQFKLRNPNELIKLFRIDEIKPSKQDDLSKLLETV